MRTLRSLARLYCGLDMPVGLALFVIFFRLAVMVSVVVAARSTGGWVVPIVLATLALLLAIQWAAQCAFGRANEVVDAGVTR